MSTLDGPGARFPRLELTLSGWITAIFLVVLGIGATAGGIALVAAPDGSIMQMPLRFLEGSPFADYLVPGLILLGLFGIGSLVAAALVLLRLWYAPLVAFVIGSGQMIWIVVQLAIIDEFNWLQPAMFAVGLVIAVAASVWGWPVVRALFGRERRWEPR
jgi:hypothetical protein